VEYLRIFGVLRRKERASGWQRVLKGEIDAQPTKSKWHYGETQGPSDQPALARGLTLGMTNRFFSIFLKWTVLALAPLKGGQAPRVGNQPATPLQICCKPMQLKTGQRYFAKFGAVWAVILSPALKTLGISVPAWIFGTTESPFGTTQNAFGTTRLLRWL
jgi:hypothetical protein